MDLTQFDYQDEYGFIEGEILRLDRKVHKSQKRRKRSKPDAAVARGELTDFSDHEHDFIPSYAAALDPLHHERQWIINSVGGFYRDNLITDLTRIIKGGKEANVYCCPATPETGVELIAAKLYRPRTLRHLRNDALYREGRQTRDKDGKELLGSREARAMAKKTVFGKHLGIMNWIMHEFTMLSELYEAGADVPKPIAHQGNTILMEYIGDEWNPAPALSEISLDKDEADSLLDQAMRNIRLMLSHNCVHGDLSAYNILYWYGKIFIIDFPQMVDARMNPSADDLFRRDVQRVFEYFQRFTVVADSGEVSHDLWMQYQDGLL